MNSTCCSPEISDHAGRLPQSGNRRRVVMLPKPCATCTHGHDGKPRSAITSVLMCHMRLMPEVHHPVEDPRLQQRESSCARVRWWHSRADNRGLYFAERCYTVYCNDETAKYYKKTMLQFQASTSLFTTVLRSPRSASGLLWRAAPGQPRSTLPQQKRRLPPTGSSQRSVPPWILSRCSPEDPASRSSRSHHVRTLCCEPDCEPDIVVKCRFLEKKRLQPLAFPVHSAGEMH